MSVADSLPALPILHGPHLKTEKPRPGLKRTPATWLYGVRLPSNLATAIDRAAAQMGVKAVDIIRTATAEFAEKYRLSSESTRTSQNLTDLPPPSLTAGPTAPYRVDPYRGNGGSDHQALMAVNRRNQSRKASGAQGERLIDKTPVR